MDKFFYLREALAIFGSVRRRWRCKSCRLDARAKECDLPSTKHDQPRCNGSSRRVSLCPDPARWRRRRKALPWESPFPLQELKLVKLLCFHCCIQTDCMIGSADIVEWIGSHKESKLRIEHFAETNVPCTLLTNLVM